MKVGLFFWEEEGEVVTIAGPSPRFADGTDPHLGLGLEAKLSERLGVRAEWDYYEFDGSSSDGVTASLVVRLGRG